MAKCVNDYCDHNASKSEVSIVVNCDGDMACDPICKRRYEQQRDRFFNETIHSDTLFNDWMVGVDNEL